MAGVVNCYADDISIPDGSMTFEIPTTGFSSTLISRASTDTMTLKTLVQPQIADSVDPTKKAQFDLSGITAGQTRSIKPLDTNYEITYSTYYGGAFHGSFSAANNANPILSETPTLINASGVMVRDIHADVLTIPSGFNLNTGGYRIFARKIIFTNTTSIISRNGNNASGQTGGVALAAGTCGQSMAGGTGGAINGAGSAATNTAGSLVNAVGGVGGAGANAGGASPAPAITAASAGNGSNFNHLILYHTHLAWKCRNQVNTVLTGGRGGGGGGGGTAVGVGGGGGGGGGIVIIFAHTIEILSGADSIKHIQANGGNGGNGAASTGTNSGGGGAGGSGIIYIGYNQLINFDLVTNTSATPGTGGLAGTGGTGGFNGGPATGQSPWVIGVKI